MIQKTNQNLNPIKSTPSKLNDENGFFQNIERVINPENKNKTNNATSQKQSLDHNLYWKIGRLKDFGRDYLKKF